MHKEHARASIYNYYIGKGGPISLFSDTFNNKYKAENILTLITVLILIQIGIARVAIISHFFLYYR